MLLAQACASESDVLTNVAPDIAYAYDELGRLRAVSDGDGETAVYGYDEVGNLMGVERYPSHDVSVIELSPARAEPGARVTVLGTGFDRKAGRNTVAFGEAEAEVLHATPVELRVVVPDDVSSGPAPVKVTAGGEAAEAADEFEIVGGRVPVIDEVSPEVVAPGDEIVVRGRGFTGDRLLDQVFLQGGEAGGSGEVDGSGADVPSGGGTYLTVVSSSESEIRAMVPPVAVSGQLSVATPSGTGSADGVMYVVPPVERPSVSSFLAGVPAEGELELLGPDDVGDWSTAELGKPTALEIPAGRLGLVSFAGRARTRVVLDLPGEGLDCADVDVGLVAPGGLALGVEGIEDELAAWCGGGEDEAAMLPWDGSYTLVIEPSDGASGRASVELGEVGTEPVPERLSAGALAEKAQELEDLLGEPVETMTDAGPSAPSGGPVDGVERFGVDLSTGMLRVSETDLVVDDVVPVELTRGYRPVYGTLAPQESAGAFGLGSDLSFAMELDVSQAVQSATLELADGMSIPYRRVSDGTGRDDALLEHRGTPTPFHGSTIVWNGWGWDLSLEDGSALSFIGSGSGYLVAIADAHGNRVVVEHDVRRDQLGRLSTGKASTVYGPAGRWMSFAYDDEGRIVEVSNHLGDTLSYRYERPQGLTTGEDIFLQNHGLVAGVEYRDAGSELLGEVTYGYDDHNRLASAGGAGGELLRIDYDDEGRVSRQTLTDGTEFTFEYESETVRVDHPIEEEGTVETERVTRADVTDPTGALRRVDFDDGHWVTDTWAAGGDSEQTLTAEHDPDTGFITGLTDPGDLETSYRYDADGNLVSVLEASENGEAETIFDWDRFDLVTTTGPDGLATRFGYDDSGSLTNETWPGDLETAYSYDPGGRVASVTDPAGATTGVGYELAHRVTVTAGSDNDSLSGSNEPASFSEYYDAAGRLAAATDTNGGITQYRYDAWDQLVSVTDPAGSEIAFDYDSDGNLTSLTDEAGNATAYVYDEAGNLTRRTDPAGAVDEYSYDEAGRLVAYTDRRGIRTTYHYDTLSRLIRVVYGVTADGEPESAISYAYDASGRLIQVEDTAYGTVTLAYDDLGRLVSETTAAGEVAYSYDTAGRRTAMTLPDGTETTYDYDDAGRLVAIAQGDVSMETSRDDRGRVEQLDLPNGITASYTYDQLSQLLRIDYGSLGALRYDYDTTGQQTGVSGDLAETELPDLPTEEPAYGPGNEATTWNGKELVYDEAGNLGDDGTNTYTWDARGQLTAIEGGTEASFSYDPFGRRVETTFGGETTSYLYDGQNIAQATGDDGTFTYLTGLALDEVYGRTDGEGETITYVTDAQGSVIGLAGPGGRLATSYTYTPHGERTVEGDADPNTLGFTGREHDPSGLIYYRARYYSPDLGRFISEDPIGFEAGDTNLYRYVLGDPVNLTDPEGLQPAEVAGIAVCVATAWYIMEEAFEQHDRMQEAGQDLIDGRISREEHLLILDSVENRLLELLNMFFVICGGAMELASWIGVGSAVGVFGRRLAQGALNRLPSRFPGLRPKPGLRPGGAPTPRPTPSPGTPGPKPTPPGTRPTGGLRPGESPRGPGARPGRTPHGAPCSFSADTDVLLADGSTEDISDIQPGDMVYAADPITGEQGARRVTDTWVHTDTIIDLHTTAGDITTTEDHPFWNHSEGEWQPADDLSIGDQLLTATGDTLTVLGINPASAHQSPAYTLTVADLHTFHVTVGATGHEVLVHNQCGSPPPNRTPSGAGRSGALREAKRDAGVPVTQQPTRVRPNLDRRGRPQPGRVYEYEVPAPGGGKRTVQIRDDAGGHYYGPGDPQNRGPHFNVEDTNWHYDY